jgi:hypothetical protein
MKKKFLLQKISKKNLDRVTQIYAPVFESDIEESRKVKEGQRIRASYKKSDIRNIKHNKKYFAFLNFAFYHAPETFLKENDIKSVNDLRYAILMAIGHREKRTDLNGNTYYRIKSTSFKKCGQEKFNEIYDKTWDFVCQYVLPGIDDEEIERELVNFM